MHFRPVLITSLHFFVRAILFQSELYASDKIRTIFIPEKPACPELLPATNV